MAGAALDAEALSECGCEDVVMYAKIAQRVRPTPKLVLNGPGADGAQAWVFANEPAPQALASADVKLLELLLKRRALPGAVGAQLDGAGQCLSVEAAWGGKLRGGVEGAVSGGSVLDEGFVQIEEHGACRHVGCVQFL